MWHVEKVLHVSASGRVGSWYKRHSLALETTCGLVISCIWCCQSYEMVK